MCLKAPVVLLQPYAKVSPHLHFTRSTTAPLLSCAWYTVNHSHTGLECPAVLCVLFFFGGQEEWAEAAGRIGAGAAMIEEPTTGGIVETEDELPTTSEVLRTVTEDELATVSEAKAAGMGPEDSGTNMSATSTTGIWVQVDNEAERAEGWFVRLVLSARRVTNGARLNVSVCFEFL